MITSALNYSTNKTSKKGGLTPTIRAYAPSGSTLTCDGQTYTLGSSETYHDFEVSCEKVSVLPNGYTGLEYIESTGTQYINLNLSMPFVNYGWYVDAEMTAAYSSTAVALTGVRYVSYNVQKIIEWFSGDTYTNAGLSVMDWNTWGQGISTGDISLGITTTNTRFQTSYINTTGTTMVLTKPDGTTYTNTSGTTSTTSFGYWYLFARWQDDTSSEGTSCCSAKVYSFKAYNGTDVVRNLIPCTNNLGVVGMFDKISSTFFVNSGTGSFIASTTTKEWTDYPTYTVTATLDGVTKTSEVTVDKVGLFETTLEYATYLYKYGDTCNSITGGWTSYTTGNYGTPSITMGEESILLHSEGNTNNGAGCWACIYTLGNIDWSKYSKISFDIKSDISMTYRDTVYVLNFTTNTTTAICNDPANDKIGYLDLRYPNSFEGVATIDISSLTETSNLHITQMPAYNTYIYRIWLE